MQYGNEEQSRPSQYFLALVAFIALISGAGIAIIGFIIGTHASTPILQNNNGLYTSPASLTACAQDPQNFSYTGSQQIVSVPSDCTSAIIEAVGAGGGGFASSQQTGGNGGYAAAQIKLSGISQLIVIVGQGGVGTCSGDCSGDDVLPAFGGGAGTHEGNGGGGYSGVFNGVVEQSAALVVAGGGGGSGYIYPKAIGTGINLAGSQLGLSKDADAAWKSGIGIGGQNGNGGNGRVTIIWEKEKSWYNIF